MINGVPYVVMESPRGAAISYVRQSLGKNEIATGRFAAFAMTPKMGIRSMTQSHDKLA